MDNDWNGLAELFANLITKYAGALDLDNLPDPMPVDNNIENENIFDMAKTQIDKNE
ncbi:site-specific DNA recombinase [Streptococcus pneumoniae]|nr:site-specific DNA recombinase [Streptococcus pneumoniae]